MLFCRSFSTYNRFSLVEFTKLEGKWGSKILMTFLRMSIWVLFKKLFIYLIKSLSVWLFYSCEVILILDLFMRKYTRTWLIAFSFFLYKRKWQSKRSSYLRRAFLLRRTQCYACMIYGQVELTKALQAWYMIK